MAILSSVCCLPPTFWSIDIRGRVLYFLFIPQAFTPFSVHL